MLNLLIKALHQQNKTLSRARFNYLTKEAERKHYEATEVTAAGLGKLKISHAEKVTLAQGSETWLSFHRELARLESLYQFELFKFKIMELEYQAKYLEMKQDGKEIKRPGAEDESGHDYQDI